jgi:tight adherence protein B
MFAALAAAVATAPTPSLSAARLRYIGLRPAADTYSRPAALLHRLQRRPWVVAALSGLAGGLVGAAASLAFVGRPEFVGAPASAAAIVGVVLWRVMSTEGASRRADRETLALGEAFACLADELRAGQRPALALAAAADAAGRTPIADVFGRAAATAALGGDVAAVIGEQASAFECGAAARAGVDGLTAAWAVSERSGAPLATVMERLTDDLRSRHSQRRHVLAQLAGPRATAVLLAGLPVLGILLAAGTGGRPVEILLGTPVGQVLLLVGVSLDAVGCLWCMRILGSASAAP